MSTSLKLLIGSMIVIPVVFIGLMVLFCSFSSQMLADVPQAKVDRFLTEETTRHLSGNGFAREIKIVDMVPSPENASGLRCVDVCAVGKATKVDAVVKSKVFFTHYELGCSYGPGEPAKNLVLNVFRSSELPVPPGLTPKY